jgi:hypothetical protein
MRRMSVVIHRCRRGSPRDCFLRYRRAAAARFRFMHWAPDGISWETLIDRHLREDSRPKLYWRSLRAAQWTLNPAKRQTSRA